jgi:hypothetical protein
VSVDKATRERCLHSKPDVLQLNRGPLLDYDAQRDTIYFDSESFLNLWHYVERHRWQFNRRNSGGVARGNLKGFQLIQTLGWFENNPANLNSAGFAHLRYPLERALTGLTNIRLLGHRGIHPAGRGPTPGRPLAQRLKRLSGKVPAT